jgi:phosphoglycolate phosphatase-like HAD superfamily hydrolase
MRAEPRLRYRTLILDCDGVLFDTNRVKEANIRAAASYHCDAERLERFARYFTDHNGVPREAKIRAWFRNDADAAAVLNAYNVLNRDALARVQPLSGAVAFVDAAARKGLRLIVLSGGAQDEVREMIDRTEMVDMVDEVLGGPTTKHEHLVRLALDGATCYFGDSQHDYQVARHFGFDFVFVYQYTQFVGWGEFFADHPEVRKCSALDPKYLPKLCYE